MSFHPLPVHAQGESPRSKTEDADETKSVSSAIARAFAREKFQRRVMSFVAIVAYVMSGLTIVVVNKCVVRDSGLHAPALVSSMGALFTAMTTRFLVFIGKVEVREVDLTPLEFAIWRAFPVGVLAAGSLCFGNMSYIYLDAGFIQMLKAGTPALLLFVLSVCKIEKITPLSASLALTMVCGSALATLQQPNINTWGLIIQAASQACEVLQCTAVQNFLQKLGFNAFDAGYYLAPAVAMCCLLSSMAIEWPQIIRDQQVWLLCSQLPLLLASGSIGIVVNLSSLLVIKYTSSLLAKLLVIVRSSVLVLFFIVLGEEFTWLQVVGYMVTIMAFSGYSALKATEVDKKQQDEDLKRLSSMEEGALEEAPPAPSTFEKVFKTDLTSFFFWFALLIVVGSGYQAFVLGVIESREGIFGHPYGLGTMEVPPVPYVKTEKAPVFGAPVQSSLKVLYLDEGHFLLHVNKTARLLQRSKEDYLSSAWLVTSSQFGTVQLRAMEQDETRWLDCELGLTINIREACDFWMTPTRFDGWAKTMDGQRQEFILRRADRTEGNTSVAQNGTYLMWHSDATLFHVADWVPEACSLQPLPPAPERYTPAANEVTVTFFTKFDRYEKLLQFREVLTSVFMHLKESEFYVKEFLAIDEWYDGPSIALDGTKRGLTVEDSRAQSSAFFPGCVALNASEAADRPPSQRCSFLAKSEQQHGEAQSLNILLSLVTTKYWLHIDMDTVFHQDFYLSRLLQPIYEQKERCDDAIALASPPPPTTTKATTTPELSRTDEETWQEDTGSSEEAQEEDISYEDYDEDTDEEGLDEDESEAEEKPLYYKGEFFGPRDFRSIGATWSQRRLKDLPACRAVAGVRLDAGEMIQGRRSTTKPYRLERYRAPKALYNDTYVEELLNISAVLDKESPKWEAFQKAVRWPLFRLRSGLFDLTFVKSMEAPKMGSGVFSEDEDFRQSQLEFALRWARSGAKYAYLTHSLC